MARLFELNIYKPASVVATALLTILLTLFSACQPDNLVDESEAQPAILHLQVTSKNQTNATTRTVNEDAISDLHILVYDSNHELIGQAYNTTNGTITVNTRAATGCTIYAIANTGDANLFNGAAIHSEDNLKSMTRSITTWDALNTGTNLPMTGIKEKVNIEAGTHTLTDGMQVSRMAARITLDVSVASSADGITIDSYRICNIPTKSYYILRALGTETKEEDTQVARADDAAQLSMTADWTDSGNLSPATSTTILNTFYIFENRAGMNLSILQQQDKTLVKAPACATYIEIYGKATNYKGLTWRIYLGTNNTNNFNVKRNCTYIYTIKLTPTKSDARVTNNVWAGSNIYWNITKNRLTFDETIQDAANNSDLKQGVLFQWGSLIGISPTPAGTIPSTYYRPIYASQTWETGSLYTSYTNVPYVNDNHTGDRNDTYLNDVDRNTDDYYAAYKGDICRYLSKTNAVAGNWRMPTSAEFGTSGYTHASTSVSSSADEQQKIGVFATYVNSIYGVTRFPASGRRGSNGGLLNVGAYGYYWSSSAYSDVTAYFLEFGNGNAYPANAVSRQYGFSVRCVRAD